MSGERISMRTWKLVSGIISIVFTAVVMLQSCAAGVVDAFAAEGGTSGFSGFIVGLLMIAGGIVSVAARDADSIGADTAQILIYGFAANIGAGAEGAYAQGDLKIFSFWCLLCSALAGADALKRCKR